jgi:hypothetical protein
MISLDSFQELIEDCVNAEVAHRPIFKSITLRLELIIIDTILEDQSANIFWKKHFLEDVCLYILNCTFIYILDVRTVV